MRVLLLLLLIPILPIYAEVADTPSTLNVTLDNEAPYVYRDQDGYVTVVGQVINNGELSSVTNVQVSASFYDETSTQPMEINTARTVLEVIPPMGSSPYVIKSQSPNPAIVHVSVDLEGFESSQAKMKQLAVDSNRILYVNDTLHFTGVLKNTSAPTHGAYVYMAFYDNFDPPRIINVHSIPLGSIIPNDYRYFDYNDKINRQASGFYLFSESEIFYSDLLDVTIPEPITSTKLITIKNVLINDNEGNPIPELFVGEQLNIYSESRIQFSADQATNETPYTYYIQVKKLGDAPYIEYIGKYDGRYIGTSPQSQSIDWIPENPGEYFIETYIWDRDNIPIADPGPIILISVN